MRISAPIWGLAAVNNPALKKAAPLRTTHPSRNISPAQDQLNSDVGASPVVVEHGNELTDAEGDNAQRGACPADLPFSRPVLAVVAALGVDLDALINRYKKLSAKAAAKGRPIADPSAYLLKMARDACAKACGVSVEDIQEATSSNEWERRAARRPDERHRPKDLTREGTVTYRGSTQAERSRSRRGGSSLAASGTRWQCTRLPVVCAANATALDWRGLQRLVEALRKVSDWKRIYPTLPPADEFTRGWAHFLVV